MRFTLAICFAALLFVACSEKTNVSSASPVIPLEDIHIAAVNKQEDFIFVHFKPKGNIACKGIQVEVSEETRSITFVRGEIPGALDVDSVAVLSEDPELEGYLRVAVKVPEGLVQEGGKIRLFFPGRLTDSFTWSYPGEEV